MRIGQKLKLIDLDACVCYTNREEYSGVKYSSAYVPPELLYATHDTVVILCPFAETRIRKQSLSSAGAAGSTGRRNSIQYGITKDTVLYNGITANERSHLQGSWTDSGIVESKHTSNNGDNSSGSGDSYRDRSRSAYRINDNDINEPVYHRRDRVFSIDSSSYVRRNSMTRSDDSVGTSAQCMSVGTCTQSLSTVAQQLDEVPSPLYFDNDQNRLSLSPESR